MKTILARGVAFLLVVGFVCSPVWATCGGGGGGGGGGMQSSGSGGEQKVVYHVPWKLHDAAKPIKAGLDRLLVPGLGGRDQKVVTQGVT